MLLNLNREFLLPLLQLNCQLLLAILELNGEILVLLLELRDRLRAVLLRPRHRFLLLLLDLRVDLFPTFGHLRRHGGTNCFEPFHPAFQLGLMRRQRRLHRTFEHAGIDATGVNRRFALAAVVQAA